MTESKYTVVGNRVGGKELRLANTVLARVYYKYIGSGDGPPLEFRVRVKDVEAYELLLKAIAENAPYYKDEFQVLNLRRISVLYATYEYENANASS